ncbi:MAG: anthranilate synthase component I family protein [Saprospiraceae bacterium]|jgi:anthranilate synthase component 1
MEKIKLKVVVKRKLADFVTPVSLYLRLRDYFTEPVLLESNDFNARENSYSFIGLDAIASIEVRNQKIITLLPNSKKIQSTIDSFTAVADAIGNFLDVFETNYESPFEGFNGIFGHVGFEAVQYFDSLQFQHKKRDIEIPDIRYTLHRFIIGFNHYNEELVILENILPGSTSKMERLETLLQAQTIPEHQFHLDGNEKTNLSDEAFKELVRIGKRHCQLGDVFQIVFSRQFSQAFQGDEFNVYRVLRSINPSPYLFYFDYGDYKIFGSSPESQLVVKDEVATVNPIAGTYKRTGDTDYDAEKAMELAKDPKENAEHIMLVDLARNDLGRHAESVQVKSLKEIQYFSHVIHLVSKVQGKLPKGTNPVTVFGDTFPAGTLSGAPKFKAIELIAKYENTQRSFYGGALGYISFSGELNKAIVIRSFLSKNNVLYYQAGAGIVAASNEDSELQEVNNKLGALKRALVDAEKI